MQDAAIRGVRKKRWGRNGRLRTGPDDDRDGPEVVNSADTPLRAWPPAELGTARFLIRWRTRRISRWSSLFIHCRTGVSPLLALLSLLRPKCWEIK